jgi:ISXO2-like transposase domain/Transposase zinc-ribbon domain
MFNNLHELIATMPDEKSCRDYLIKERWNGVITCPYCGFEKAYVIENGKRFKCASKLCYKKFSVTVGTIFEASNIPLNKWFMACYLVNAHKKGISSYQLAKDIGTSQKTAWFMLHRLRAMMKTEYTDKIKHTAEADETYMARKYRSDYKGLPENEIDYKMKHAKDNKGAVLGMADRKEGIIRVLAFPSNKKEFVTEAVIENLEKGANLHTDETNLYNSLEQEYHRESVQHGKREWVKTSISAGKVHTNHVENFWSVMKRGVYGIYHQISYKHLQRYCDEYSYRYNSRKLKDNERFMMVFENMGRRLDYKTLTGKK